MFGLRAMFLFSMSNKTFSIIFVKSEISESLSFLVSLLLLHRFFVKIQFGQHSSGHLTNLGVTVFVIC